MIYSFNSTVNKGDKICFISNGDTVKYKAFDKTITCTVGSLYKYYNDIYKCITDTVINEEFDISKFKKIDLGYIESGIISTSPSTKFKIDINSSNTISGLVDYKFYKTQIREIEIVDCISDFSFIIFGES